MSTPSITYHNLPSLETILAYKKGLLSDSERTWVEQVLQQNEMVRAVAEDAENIPYESVVNITQKTQGFIASNYSLNPGLWSKYGAWIGLSSIALVIGLFLWVNNHTTSSDNYVENITTSEQTQQISETLEQETFVQKIEEGSQATKQDPKDFKETYLTPVVEDKMVEEFQETERITPSVSTDEQSPAETITDNTRSFAEESSESSMNKMVLLSVHEIQILTKYNPADVQVKNNSKNAPPYTSGTKKNKNIPTYTLDDMPKYPGGDQALQNYFKGKLMPVQIKKSNDKYDKSVVIDLEINASGKLKDYKIYGQLYPEHQKALIQAIKDLPRFQKGSQSVSYSLGIAF